MELVLTSRALSTRCATRSDRAEERAQRRQEMRERIQRRSAAAEARMDLATGGVESQIQDIERESLNIQVEDTLTAYKRQMGMIPDSPVSTPAPPSVRSDSAAEKTLGPSERGKALE